MAHVSMELSRGALLREDTGFWMRGQALKLLRAIEPICTDVVRSCESERSSDAAAWRDLVGSIRKVLAEG